MTIKLIVFFQNLHFFILFCIFLLFAFLLRILNKNRSHTTIFPFKNCSIGLIWSGQIFLYGFYSFFKQVLIEFLFVVYICCSLCNCKKKKWRRFLMPFYRDVCTHKLIGCLQLLSKGFHYFETNCFLKKF